MPASHVELAFIPPPVLQTAKEVLMLLVSADFRTRYSLMYEPPRIQTGVMIVIDVPKRMSTVHHQDKGRLTAVTCRAGTNPPGDDASLIFKPLMHALKSCLTIGQSILVYIASFFEAPTTMIGGRKCLM